MGEVNERLNDCICTHNKKVDFYYINCEFVIELDNIVIANIKTNYFINTDFININKYLIYDIDCFKSRGYKFLISVK